MKKRNIMAVVLLSIVTLGIYDLYWLVKVKKELNARTQVHTPTLWLLFAPYIVVFIGAIVSAVVAEGGSSDPYAADSSASAVNVIVLLVYLFAFLVIVPVTFYWFFKFSKAVHQYTGGQMNTAMTFILLWLLRFIGIAVIQDHFNDMVDGTAPAPGVSAAAAPQPMQPAQPMQPTGSDQTPGAPMPPANPIG